MVPRAMIQRVVARLMLRLGYRLVSPATNRRRFLAAAAEIESLVESTPEAVLRGRARVGQLPGVSPWMRSWSTYMTIAHLNLVHEGVLEGMARLEHGERVVMTDLRVFDKVEDCGAEVMTPFRELAGRIAAVPDSCRWDAGGTLDHPFFGRLDLRGAYALVAFHLRMHVPQIRQSIARNGQATA